MKHPILILSATLVALLIRAEPALANPVKIVAAENFYADIALQIGGAQVEARAILTNPDQDPHVFEASPSVAQDVKSASIVILNGAGYDEWMSKLLTAAPLAARKTINVAALAGVQIAGVQNGENPHLWYDVTRIAAMANEISAQLTILDPGHAADYAARLQTFSASLDRLRAQISTFANLHGGTDITASEPVFGYMARALKLNMQNEKFQLAVMNNTEPAVSDVAAFEKSLKSHVVKAMLYNAQASSPAVERLKQIAQNAGIPVVPITETEPANTNYQTWMGHQIDALDQALNGNK